MSAHVFRRHSVSLNEWQLTTRMKRLNWASPLLCLALFSALVADREVQAGCNPPPCGDFLVDEYTPIQWVNQPPAPIQVDACCGGWKLNGTPVHKADAYSIARILGLEDGLSQQHENKQAPKLIDWDRYAKHEYVLGDNCNYYKPQPPPWNLIKDPVAYSWDGQVDIEKSGDYSLVLETWNSGIKSEWWQSSVSETCLEYDPDTGQCLTWQMCPWTMVNYTVPEERVFVAQVTVKGDTEGEAICDALAPTPPKGDSYQVTYYDEDNEVYMEEKGEYAASYSLNLQNQWMQCGEALSFDQTVSHTVSMTANVGVNIYAVSAQVGTTVTTSNTTQFAMSCSKVSDCHQTILEFYQSDMTITLSNRQERMQGETEWGEELDEITVTNIFVNVYAARCCSRREVDSTIPALVGG